MSPSDSPQPAGVDTDFDAALREIVNQVVRERRLTGNQILRLSAELQRLGIHRLIEERSQNPKTR